VDKQSQLDVVVKTQNQNYINIEIQLANKNDMFKRTLFYWSRLYNSQLQKGKGYHTMNPTITINICDFTLFKEHDHYHSTYHLYEDIYKVLEELAMKDNHLREAFEAWEELSQDPESIIAYQSRVKYIIDEAAALEDAKYHAEQAGIEKGIQKGMYEGIQKGKQEGMREIAKKMIAKGNRNEEIVELTNLTIQEIQVLRQEIK